MNGQLTLTIILRVIISVGVQSHTLILMKLLQKLRNELRIMVRYDRNWYTMVSNNLAYIHIGQFISRRTLLNGKKMGTLGQVVDNKPYGIKSLSRSWKIGDEIHGNLLPFPYGNLKGVPLVMVWYSSLTIR